MHTTSKERARKKRRTNHIQHIKILDGHVCLYAISRKAKHTCVAESGGGSTSVVTTGKFSSDIH